MSRLAAALLGAITLLGVVYALTNPPYLKPDELYHYAYVSYLLDHGRLPLAPIDGRPGGRTLWEAHQPPLYYVVVAAETWLMERVVGAVERARGVLLLGRLTSLAALLALTLVTYRMARAWLGELEAVAVAGLVGFVPQAMFIGTSVSNDLAGAAGAGAVLLLALMLVRRGTSTPRAALFGLAVGLATLLKLTGLGTAALFPLALWLSGERRPRQWLRHATVATAACLLVAGPWLLWNLAHYGDPLTLRVLRETGGSRVHPVAAAEVLHLLSFLWQSYWVDFSPGALRFAEPAVYAVLAALCLAGMAGAIRLRRDRPELRPWLALSALWLALVVVAYLRTNLEGVRWLGGGRLILPAAPTVALLLASGPLGLAGRRGPALALGLAGLFAIWAAVAPARYLPAFGPAPSAPSRPLEAHFEAGVRLLGVDVDDSPLAPGERREVTLYWQAERSLSRPYFVRLVLVGGDGRTIARWDSLPSGGTDSTLRWRPGEVVADGHAIQGPDGWVGPARLTAALVDWESGRSTPVTGPSAASERAALLAELEPARERADVDRPARLR